MFPHSLFNGLSGERIRDIHACMGGYDLLTELLDKHVKLPSATNIHYPPRQLYDGLLYLSMGKGYAESSMEDLKIQYGTDAPCGGAFLYRLKKLGYDDAYSMLTNVNDELLSRLEKTGVLKRRVVCALDYTKVPYYGAFNPKVVRSKHEKGTNLFYEYASLTIVEDGRRVVVYTRPVTLLDVKRDVVKELITEAEKRGIRIKLLLLDRAFYTVDCINLLDELRIRFIMPCVCNQRVDDAVSSLGKEGTLPFEIRDNSKHSARFTMVVYKRKRDGKLIPFATNIRRPSVKMVPRGYRRRWGIETSFRKIKEVFGRTTSRSNSIRLIYFLTAQIIHNVWQIINIQQKEPEQRRDDNDDGQRPKRPITMGTVISIFKARLNGRC